MTDDLRTRVARAIQLHPMIDGLISTWVATQVADAVLAAIEETHLIVPRGCEVRRDAEGCYSIIRK